jgi:hypothetical protein
VTRQPEASNRAPVRRVHGEGFATVGTRDHVDDGEPEAGGAGGPGGVAPAEALEGMPQEIRRESATLIAHRELDDTVWVTSG